MKICPKCSTDNDDNRTVCLDCGDNISGVVPTFGFSKPKLNESTGASAPEITRFKAPPPRKQLKKPSPWKSLFSLRNLFLWVVLIGFVYAFYLALTPPQDLEEITRDNDRTLAPHVMFDISHVPEQETTTRAPQPPPPLPQNLEICATQLQSLKAAASSSNGTWSINKKALNQHLATKVQLTPVANQFGIHTSFKGCFVNLHEGDLDFVMKQRVFDRDLVFTLRLQPVSSTNATTFDFTGAWIGSLPIHPLLIPTILPVFSPCYDAMKKAITPLKSASSITISPVNVVVRWPETSVK